MKCRSGWYFAKRCFWHDGKAHEIRNLQEIRRDPDGLNWNFRGSTKDGLRLNAAIDGAGASIHRLPYLKTNCAGSFEVVNNSLATAVVRLDRRGKSTEDLETKHGAVLEMVGGRL